MRTSTELALCEADYNHCGHTATEAPAEGHKTCYMCGGNGQCRTCWGRGWISGAYGTPTPLDCSNCTGGVCRRCNGSGKVFTFSD